MYSRLSPSVTQFINREAIATSEHSYRHALKKYTEEITSIIKEVCDELSEQLSNEEWTIEAEDDDYDDSLQRTRFVLRESHTDATLTLHIDDKFNSYWTYHNSDIDEYTIKAIENINTPATEKYFDIYCSEDGLTIVSTFSRRQLISRHVVDYILHLTDQMRPVISAITNHNYHRASPAQ